MNSNGSRRDQCEPWERRSTETGKQFAAFVQYRDLHVLSRSLARVGQQLGMSTSYLERLSTKFDWVERAAAFDQEQDHITQAQRVVQIAEMNTRHAEIAATALRKVAERLETIDADSLRPNEIARLLEIAARAERLARGVLSDEPVVVEHGPRFRADDIRRMLKENGLIPDFFSQ